MIASREVHTYRWAWLSWVVFAAMSTATCVLQTWMVIRVFINDVRCRKTNFTTFGEQCPEYVNKPEQLAWHCHCANGDAVFNNGLLSMCCLVFITNVVVQIIGIIVPCLCDRNHAAYDTHANYTLFTAFGLIQLVFNKPLRRFVAEHSVTLINPWSLIIMTAKDTLAVTSAHIYAKSIDLSGVEGDKLLLSAFILSIYCAMGQLYFGVKMIQTRAPQDQENNRSVSRMALLGAGVEGEKTIPIAAIAMAFPSAPAAIAMAFPSAPAAIDDNEPGTV